MVFSSNPNQLGSAFVALSGNLAGIFGCTSDFHGILSELREIPSITRHQRIVQKIPENINILSNYEEHSKRKQRNIDKHCKT